MKILSTWGYNYFSCNYIRFNSLHTTFFLLIDTEKSITISSICLKMPIMFLMSGWRLSASYWGKNVIFNSISSIYIDYIFRSKSCNQNSKTGAELFHLLWPKTRAVWIHQNSSPFDKLHGWALVSTPILHHLE